MTAAASIAGALAQMGQQVGLITNGRDAAERIRREGWTHDQLRTRREAQAVGDERDNHRLQPVIVPTRRSNIQLRQILETLARVEKSDGLPFHAAGARDCEPDAAQCDSDCDPLDGDDRDGAGAWAVCGGAGWR